MATVKLLLADRDGIPRASLSALKWAWFDQTAPNSFVTPTDSGAIEVTDANAILEITLTGTALTPGQYGCLALSTSDDVDLGLYKLVVRA